MPFSDRSAAEDARGAADAPGYDVITRLAKPRSLFVIARGSVFALHERHIGREEAGRMLNVDHIAGGAEPLAEAAGTDAEHEVIPTVSAFPTKSRLAVQKIV